MYGRIYENRKIKEGKSMNDMNEYINKINNDYSFLSEKTIKLFLKQVVIIIKKKIIKNI